MVGNLIKMSFALLALAGGGRLLAQSNSQVILSRLDSTYRVQQQDAERRIAKFLKNHGGARMASRSDGSVIALVDVSPSGVPIYIKADNLGVATSLGVNEMRTGGSLGLNLEGMGIQVGIWDEGKVRNDHVEYAGRVTQIDNASTFSTHASHVLGTIMASGINANAKGMAPKSTAIAYDFFNDVSEMISKATPDQTSIILSNHSYGTLAGWDFDGSAWSWHGDPAISSTVDWKFGFYNSASNLYDDIAFNAPYYLIVKSAGNDNTDTGDGSRPPDCNPFDCIPTNGVAKNILTVGAARKLTGPYTGPADVVITTFSSLGPTDDGRIKPDIVAPGQGVFSASASSTSSYTTLSGTSMSSPAATGALVLLQELHKNLNGGHLMKASTLKALVIHSAREAGPSPGPDFKFGWGLLNAEGAAKILMDKDDQNIFVRELSLNNNGVFELELNPKENTKITATLVWADPAGTVQAPSLNPTTKMLKNDLDLRLVDDGGTTQFPWILNAASPALAATKGNNVVDNVEKLEFGSPEPRVYKLRVSHKGTLVNGKQDFSLIVTYSSIVDPRVSYYWIGNSGDWDNGANWSLASNGAPANAAPTAADRVVFDENSFSANNQTVNLTQDQQCYSIRWFANENITLSFNNHQLTVGEGVNLLSNNISTMTSGSILFSGMATTAAMVNLANNNLKDLSLKFSGPGSSWSLSGDFTVHGIELIEGSVILSDNSIKLNELTSSGSLSKQLTLDSMTLSGNTSLLADFANLSLEGSGSSIKVPALSDYDLNLGNNFFDGTINLMGGQLTVDGSGIIDGVTGSGTLIVMGNNTWNKFSLNAGSVLKMAALSQQTMADEFAVQALANNRVVIETIGAGNATMNFEKHRKICTDHIDVVNVSISGNSIVNAGPNSTLTNAPNWLKDSCDNILFPDFEIGFNCEGAAVFFTDKSSGPITGRLWNFGDSGAAQNESSLANPIHLFESKGTYVVSLELSGGAKKESYSQTIELKSSKLPANKVELSNGRLISFLPADKYQWVLNGELLNDTNLRSIDFSHGFGLYAVLTFDSVCNRQSETFLVTRTDTNENKTPGGVLIHPNPARGELFVENRNGGVRNVGITNNLGQLKYVTSEQIEGGWRLDISNLPAGIYVLQVQTETNHFFYRLVIQ